MLNLSRLNPFERNAEQVLGLLQMFRMLGADITEEAVNGAQAHIPGAGSILAVVFQVAKKGRDPLHRKLFYCEGCSASRNSGRKTS
jgi:hypothetical protein